MPPLTIATRKSPLARKQTELVRRWLKDLQPNETWEALPLSTRVDERLSWSLEKRGGIGLFTKELEAALLDQRAMLAVHSAKDLPTQFQAGLAIAGYLPRARANDILVCKIGTDRPARIATSSPRRRAQMALRFPRAEWTTIRGNVATRMGKLLSGEADASLLAAAGLDRLGIDAHEGLSFETLPIEAMVPAPGQAAIAIQCRKADLPRFQGRFCPTTERAVSLERAFLKALGGGCQTPVGAHFDGTAFHLFHPQTGYRRFDFTLDSLNKIEPRLQTVFDAIEIHPAT